MKFSRMFMPTTKETPSDATLVSHQFLIRGGFISQSGAGLYDFLPLGKIVLDKIRAVVKEEMDNTGANEMLCSFVTPMSYWEQSGRNLTMGNELLRFKDRKHGEYVLSPTNEESVVNMVKNRITSYKNLPVNLYHINLKFRDEARPRFGLMRGREFLMKDAYSFHDSAECLQKEFEVMEEAYKRIYTRLGLDFRVVDADSGAIGGSGSKEFHVLANSGEDTIVVCPDCEYGANIEAATRKPNTKESLETAELTKVETPNCKTIEEVSTFLNADSYYSMKAVIKKAIFEESNEVVVFFVRGCDELEETKACNSIGALELEDANDDDIAKAGLVAGYCGIVDLPEGIKVVVDQELKNDNNLVCGANEENYHLTGVDLTSMEDLSFSDLITVQEGDSCSCCGGKLEYTKGIEAGHIFQLGTKYSEAMDAKFLDANGKTQPFVMGCYGVGVSRLVAAVIEQHHDEKGCIWTKETAPFLVDVIVSNAKKDEELDAGMKIYEGLKAAGISTIIDDRKKERFGFKIGDFELIGFPYAIVIGKKLQDGMVEIVDRKTGDKTDVSLEEAVSKLSELLK
ncbi:proline--tRNA ligase [Poseidonibacter lekithochrous]|uniref:proline--tRNA ligase n=1 Tax=Poseidonibacter lekithochrous TaxID=1904463 RepID=UPI0008FCB484|nr:proline--tRNA ligase [Poseidonibacter lekithochrous]QKJ21936.1 prolyl-tRNA synthetase [Poseidonibacter lekithochrous]